MNQKGFANILLVILVIVVVGVASYFALVRKSPPAVIPQTITPATQEPVTQEPAPTLTPPPIPVITPQQNQEILSVSKILKQKEEYLGKRVMVKGEATLESFCSPYLEPNNIVCQNTIFLLDKDTDDKVALFKNGWFIGCDSKNSPPSECSGWVKGKEYTVTGKFSAHLMAGSHAGGTTLAVDIE